MKNIIITGPTGAIGQALVRLCLQEGHDVYAVCHEGSKRIEDLPKNEKLHIVQCDLKNIVSLKDKIHHECDVFYHFAWEGTTGIYRNDTILQTKNVQYTLDAVDIARALKCKVFIGAGSQAEYGRYEGKLTNRTPTFPENGYGVAKLCAGQMSRIKCSQLGIRHIWFRILSIYGPYDTPNSMVMSVIRQLDNGDVPSLTKGEQLWDYLYSYDAAKALYLAAEKGIDGAVYPLGSGRVCPLKEYVEVLRDCMASNSKLGFGDVPYGEKQVMYLCADIDKLSEDTGFSPVYSFELGIKETIEWYKEKKANEKN